LWGYRLSVAFLLLEYYVSYSVNALFNIYVFDNTRLEVLCVNFRAVFSRLLLIHLSGEVNFVADEYAWRIREDFVYLFPPFVEVFEGFTPRDIEDVNNASGTTIKVLTDNLEL